MMSRHFLGSPDMVNEAHRLCPDGTDVLVGEADKEPIKKCVFNISERKTKQIQCPSAGELMKGRHLL